MECLMAIGFAFLFGFNLAVWVVKLHLERMKRIGEK
jgi:hypothetical protein